MRMQAYNQKDGKYLYRKMQKRRLEANKKGNAFLIIILIALFLFVTSTQKIEINENQIKTATPSTCGMINKAYDPINKICIQNAQNTTKTT